MIYDFTTFSIMELCPCSLKLEVGSILVSIDTFFHFFFC